MCCMLMISHDSELLRTMRRNITQQKLLDKHTLGARQTWLEFQPILSGAAVLGTHPSCHLKLGPSSLGRG